VLAAGEAGFSAILVVGMIGLVLGLVMVYVAFETHSKAALGEVSRARLELRQTGQSAVRQLDQWVRASYLRADCAAKSLRPQFDAPPAVAAHFAGGGFGFTSCDPRSLKSTAAANDVFRARGRVPSPASSRCERLSTQVSVQEVDWDDRYVVVAATTGPGRKTPLANDVGPQIVKARVDLPPPPVPSFGLLVNDLHCGMCHVRVNGDVASTKDVTTFWENPARPWRASVGGTWYAARSWDADGSGRNITIDVAGGVIQRYRGPKLPGRYRKSGGTTTFTPQFPTLDFARIGPYVNPDPYSCASRPLDEQGGNTVMIGADKDHPIALTGDLHIRGDLVITGWYTGVGTIYVDGNVYVPFDLRAVRSIFPYPADADAAAAAARASVQRKSHDALAIATKRSIVIGEFDDEGIRNHSVWYHDLTPPDKRGDVIGVKDIYKWYPGGKAGYEALFGTAYDCVANTPAGHRGSINVIDAYLYAENTIGGLARRNSYAINGGIIADNFHVVSAARDCAAGIHPIHGQSMAWSYVNYDYRMRYGLPLLDRFAEFFQPP
jgi:hypothetical protein